MDIITAATMESLIAEHGGPCVSIYLPTHRSGRETLQGPIRLGNLAGEARRRLVATGMRDPEAVSLLSGVGDLVDDTKFWQYQEEGLALFASAARTRSLRLPVDVPELVVVSDAFHVKPLWPAVAGDVFHILALSRNEVRLYWADRFRIGEVDLPEDLPKSLAEALWFDDPEKQLQYHAAARVGTGRLTATFHGHGGPDERGSGARLDLFLRAVDRGLHHIVPRRAPLLLAGVEELAGRFREVSAHRGIVDRVLGGNPEETPIDDLHREAVAIMSPLLELARRRDAEAFEGAGELAVSEVRAAVTAALAGRVAALFLPLGVQAWGRVGDDGETVVHADRLPGDRDLFDVAGVATWSARGTVHAVAPDEVPGPGPVAARLRY